MLTTLAMLISLSASGQAALAARASNEVDVELVLAVDTSRSMDYEESQIQRDGYVSALQHPDFINAVKNGLTGRIAISYFEWAGEVQPDSVIDWQIIASAEDARAFAEKLAARPIITQRRTSISAAISYGTSSLISNAYKGMRQVIDISGDGPNNIGAPVAEIRDKAVEAGVTINGLPLVIRPSVSNGTLDKYYADCVIGGNGSFVLPVHKIEDFAAAVRRKLILEVSGLEPPAMVKNIAASKADCLAGEQQWRDFLDR